MFGGKMVEDSFKICSCILPFFSSNVSFFLVVIFPFLLLPFFLLFHFPVYPQNQASNHHHHGPCHFSPANAADMNPGLTTGCSSKGDHAACNDRLNGCQWGDVADFFDDDNEDCSLQFVWTEDEDESDDCSIMMISVMMIVLMMMTAWQTARWSRSVCSVVKPLLHRFPYLAPITPASQ